MAGLRERKKATAMRHIQTTALRLFSEQGFGRVTIEQVAEQAQVSPSTVYRYFGTKEGLVLHDEFDDRVFSGLATRLAQGIPLVTAGLESLAAVADEHFDRDREQTRQRTELWLTEPSVQASVAVLLHQLAESLADPLVEGGGYSPLQARVVISALLQAFIATLARWHAEGCPGRLIDHVTAGLEALTRTMNEAAS